MLKFRQFMRKEVLEVNNQEALATFERVKFGFQFWLASTDNAKIKKKMELERDFIESSALIRNYTVFIKRACNDFFKDNKGGELTILLDKECEKILPRVIKNKALSGYDKNIGYVDDIALKTVKHVRIPLIITEVIK